jgi:hypothetical protein
VPYPLPSRRLPGPRRRALLVSAAGAALLTGCSSGSAADSPGDDATARARARAARDSRTLAGRYDAVLAVHPGLAERLTPLRAEVLRHAQVLGAGASPSTAAPAAASPSTSPSPSAPAAVPGDERGALRELAAAERSLADRRADALRDAEDELARLLASVAAAGAAHAYLLTEDVK